ncbi:cell division protein SepF [Lactobacillus hominis]|uniref:Cell division protein SepF n=1 Tax=Lactobacillus hominis DSM 23910 = CRBIP 24.179 TaxID=1423758 RepID=I7L4R2_9LACO|nr:cell division protein SepF [Lactobacillus hominis]KRM86135.1 cell division protein [Lactobacillus hominis DSM 23910 = CRBIP 24.179]MCT3348643.1 cell division protein SepF [Lactobacillus hominis]CCI80907.1 Cell division protein sepF [Lactobacillus hominis DSM 23910 = CRBIP 24.179]
MAFDKLGRFFGIAEDEDMNESSYTEEMDTTPEPEKNERRANVVSINSGSAPTSKIVLYEPRVYSDAKEVAQNLLSNKAIIINFARMDDAQSRRIVDFITGTVYALNGEIQRVGDKIFLATPPKFETDGKIAELVDKKDNID